MINADVKGFVIVGEVTLSIEVERDEKFRCRTRKEVDGFWVFGGIT